MRIKKYEGSTMRETMAKVRADLGPDAVILKTRKHKPGGLLNLLAKEVFEVTAAIDVDLPTSPAKPRPSPETNSNSSNKPHPSPETNSNSSRYLAEQVETIKSEIGELKSLVWSLARQVADPDTQNSPDILAQAYGHLLGQEVERELAKDLILSLRAQLLEGELADTRRVRGALCGNVAEMINTSGPLTAEEKRKVVVLVGPTGTGKTTTIAKLAAQFSLFERKNVGMITADTYRIAAVDQLKTYTEIIGVPLEVVYSQQDMKEALVRQGDKDLILVDTVGRSPRDIGELRELTECLKSYVQTEVHLVLSVSTKFADQMDTINRFGPTSLDKLIFTKLDETTALGTLLNVMANVNADISYVTTGQNVPDDIEVAEPGKIAEMIVGA